jgi:hypothetical protein
MRITLSGENAGRFMSDAEKRDLGKPLASAFSRIRPEREFSPAPGKND